MTPLEQILAGMIIAFLGVIVGRVSVKGLMKRSECQLLHKGLGEEMEGVKDRLERIERKIDTLNGNTQRTES